MGHMVFTVAHRMVDALGLLLVLLLVLCGFGRALKLTWSDDSIPSPPRADVWRTDTDDCDAGPGRKRLK